MKAVFADTLYWAALTAIDDPAHDRALELSRSLEADKIVTTDEVLAEYLTFFAGARPNIRDWVGRNVAELIDNLEVRIVPQSRESFLAGLELCRAPSRQRLQPHRLRFNADDATGRAGRRAHQRPAF